MGRVEMDRAFTLVPWINWPHNQAGGTGRFEPGTLAELVAAVRLAESEGKKIKAVGSSWSYTGVAKPDWYWLKLDRLNRLIATDMTRLVRPGLEADRFVHVQAGIKLHQLNEMLWDRERGMRTLGGSQGQSLAGAISTATHGGDFDRPPIADTVRAIHLVGRGGREYSIEPKSNPLTGLDVLPIPEWSNALEIIRDDEVFYAVLISMGRSGVVYSYVIEVEPAYDLEELRYNALWQGQLGGNLEVMWHTLLTATIRGFDAWTQPSPLGSRNPLRYLQIDIDPNGVQAAYVTKRWATPPSARVDSPPSNPTTFDRDAHFIGFARTNQSAWTDHIYLSTVRNAFASARYPRLVRDRSYFVMAGRPAPYPSYGEQMEAFWAHMWRVDSIEFFFDARNPIYINFVDALLNTWNTTPGRKIGYISLRFMGQSRATLAMQRWPVTVSIECAFFRGFPGTELGIQAALSLGNRYNAVFHWGQLTPPGYGGRLPEIFGSALNNWRMAIARVGAVPDDAFSTDYSKSHELEPVVVPSRATSELLLLLS